VRRRWSVLFILAVVFAYSYMLAPAFVIVTTSFNPSISLKFPPEGFSLTWYREFAASTQFIGAFGRSLVLALMAALTAALLGVPAAMGIARYQFRGRNLLQTFLLAPLFVPSIIIGVALLNFFVVINLRGTFLALLLAHALLTFPYVVRTVTASLAGLDPALEEGAAVLGATPWQTFTRVTLPLISSGIFAGVLFAFVISFGELNASIFLSGPTTVTLPIQIFSYLQWDTSPIIAAISAVQIGLNFTIAIIIDRVFGLNRAIQFG